jgi:hypothetical protein
VDNGPFADPPAAIGPNRPACRPLSGLHDGPSLVDRDADTALTGSVVDDTSSSEDGFENDYDLLTQFEAGRRLVENIERVREECSDAEGDDETARRERLAALEDAVKRHHEQRPAERSTFFRSSGGIERVDTTRHH